MSEPPRRLDYHVVDVFADRPYAGNPLAVVLDADELSTAQMQGVAREFNLSETTFVLALTNDAASYRVRIFTPAAELPFAGHPSVGTAWLLARLGRIAAGDVVQDCPGGLMPITVDGQGATLTGGPPTGGEPVAEGPFLSALGLAAADFAGSPVRVCGCGLDWAYLHVHDEALARVQVDLAALAALPGAGVYVFSVDGERVHARSFAAGVGVPEDPATGSAALGLGAYLVASGIAAGDGGSAYTIDQGLEMGRPSRLDIAADAAGGAATRVRVRGDVHPVMTGHLTIAG